VRREERNGMMKRTAYLASIAALALSAVLGPSAQAKFVITLSEVGPNVVEIDRGTIDVTDLGPPFATFTEPANIFPSVGEIAGGSGSPQMDFDSDFRLSAPGIFGSGGWTFANLGIGDPVNASLNIVAVPVGYQSGAPLSNSSFFADATFSSLGAISGAYVWRWGTGADADTLTLQIGPSVSTPAAPEPSTWAIMLIGFGGLSYTAARRARAHRAVSA
jgi:hypothetical protein